MFIPIIPRTTIINKTIVYSDTVLSLNDLGENLQVTTVKNVEESEFESCLKTIFNNNPDTTFNTIQYARQDKKIYLYTNKTISTTEWYQSKIKKYKPLTTTEEIIEEIEHIKNFDENNQPEDTMIPITYDNAISLYDIARVLKIQNSKFENDKKTNSDYLDQTVDNEFSSSSSIIIYGFDYDTDTLRVGFKRWEDYDEIKFKKEDDDFYISESESYYAKEILALLGNTLSHLYDLLLAHKPFKTERAYKVKPVNSNILVDISSYGVKVYIPSSNNRFTNDFELECFSYTNDFKYDCNSNNVINAIKNQEIEFLKHILIDIEDTPEWMHPILKSIREKQLQKPEPIKIFAKPKEKSLTLGKRILNWFTK